MVSQQLIEQWREKLAVWQQRLDEGRPRPWMARAYVRVLRFLLAQYATAASSAPPLTMSDSASTEQRESAHSTSKAVHLAVADPLSGKPPRTGEDIRSVLQAVRAQVPRAAPGPLVDGLSPDDPILLAEFYSLPEVERLVGMLGAESIEWRTQRFRRKVQVFARQADLERAKPIVARHAVDAYDSPKWRIEFVRRYAQRVAAWIVLPAFFFLFLVLPLFAGYVSAGGGLSDHSWPALLFAIALVGALASVPCGWLLGYSSGFIASRKVRRKPRR